MPNPKAKNPKAAKGKTNSAGKTEGGTDASSGLSFGPLDKLSPGSLMKMNVMDLIQKMNPLSFIIPSLGGANKEGGIKKKSEDMILKMVSSFACSGCCSCLPYLLIIFLLLLVVAVGAEMFNDLIEGIKNLF